MRFTKKTREILNFIDEYGFITNNICSRTIFKGGKQAYTQSQKKLKIMCENKAITKYIHPVTKEFIYQVEKKEVDDHRRMIIDLYSRIYEFADEIIYFKIEETWATANRRNDAHIIFSKDDSVIGLLVEFDKHHKTSKKKLDDIYNSGEVQQWYLDKFNVEYFPSFLIISLLGNTRHISDNYECLAVNYEFEGLETILRG